MRSVKIRSLALLTLFFFNIQGWGKVPKIKTGYWYMAIQLSKGDILPILFNIKKDKKTRELCIINGSERIILEDITYRGDSVFILFPVFASELRAKVDKKTSLSGRWYDYSKKGNYFLPFWSKFEYSNKHRVEKPLINVTGRWEVTFDYKEDPKKSVGIFEANLSESFTGGLLHNRLTGTFLNEMGDYRFLEGATIGDSVYLSTFDGAHAFLFKAQLKKDTLWGEFLSGKHYRTVWFAVRNNKFELRHPDSLTYVTNESPVRFTLPDLSGSNYTYPNQKVRGKVIIIQIMGTWCPNCLDESLYLKDLHASHEGELEIIAVSLETQSDFSGKVEKVRSFKNNLKLPYTFLIAGEACKSCVNDIFPMLSEIISFPTLIVIDKTGEIRKVHTGFNGPGTGEYYTQFVSSTNDFIKQLVNE